VVDHKIVKTLQNFICKHTMDLENVQRSWEEKKGEFKGRQVTTN
jgi:hypothetical protein